ncbi:MAG TPA: CDGSH iron-sulfur domain-containing protein [Rubrobacteraceae bacterium]|nr:CDGSH iron-sulfur domain-containing protein [Rubrobacteraceae bacterium]
MEEVRIAAYEDGPFLVTGAVTITDAEGNSFPVQKETVALCRCGASAGRPFCDGTHTKIGFRAAEKAVREL